MADMLDHYISGQEVPGKSGRFADGYDPATGAVCSQIPLASTEEMDAAIEVAHQAFPAWAATTPLRRARVLYKFKEPLDSNAEELAKIISREHGKVHNDALGTEFASRTLMLRRYAHRPALA